jgi:hypothetical protein
VSTVVNVMSRFMIGTLRRVINPFVRPVKRTIRGLGPVKSAVSRLRLKLQVRLRKIL